MGKMSSSFLVMFYFVVISAFEVLQTSGRYYYPTTSVLYGIREPTITQLLQRRGFGFYNHAHLSFKLDCQPPEQPGILVDGPAIILLPCVPNEDKDSSQQTINMDLSHKEQICKIFQNSVSPFQRSYEFCGGFEMKCTQRRSGSCLSWEMSATIPKQDEDYYEFFLLQCPTKPKSSQNVTIPNYTAQCHGNLTLLNNYGTTHLGKGEEPLRYMFKTLLCLWVVLLAYWITNWVKYREYSNPLHKLMIVSPLFKFVVLVLSIIFWDMISRTGNEHYGLKTAIMVLMSAEDATLFMTLMLAAEGWCVMRPHIRKVKHALIPVLFLAFLASVICVIWIHSYFMMQTRSNKNQQQPTAYADFIKKKKDPSGFEVKYVSEEVGYGLFATADFEKGEFLLEYSGVLRHAYQVGEEEDTTFIFFFQSGQDSMCIDATHSTGKGKYCNDDWKKPNAVVKKIIINKQPKLAIFANSEIKKGNEIRYDYGQPDATWRKKKNTNQNKPPEVLRECNTDNEPERPHVESKCTTQIAKKQTNQNKPPEVLRECNTDNEPERAPGESECTTQIAKDNESDDSYNPFEDIDLFPWCKDTHKDVSSGGDDKGENGSDNEVSSQTSEASDNTQDKEQEWNDDQMSYVCDSEDSTNSSEYMIPLPSPKMRSHGAVCIKEHPSKSDVEHTIVSTTDHNQKQQQRHGKNRKCNQKKVRFVLEKEESVSYTDSSDSSDENNEHCSDYLPTESSSDEQMSPESNSEMDTQKRKGPGTSLKRNVDMRSSASDSEAGGNIVHSTSSSSSKLRLQNAECKVSSKTPESSCAVSSTTSETRFKKIPRVTVMTSSNGLARKWDKHQFCVFCMEQKAKLGRHFQSMHAHEPEVQEAFSFSKNSKERKELLQILTNKGNHSHNIEVLNSGTGILIPYKRPPFSVPFERYLPCENCFGYFYDGDMWKHTKKCPAKQSHSGRNNGLRSRCSLLLPLATKVDEQFKVKVIGIMRRDNISIICRNDEMILTLGQRLFAKLGTDSHNGQYVSQKMREVGRLLKNIQEVDPSLKTLAECIRPSCFDKVVEAVRKCAVYNSSTQQYQIPSLALKLGHSLKKCAAIQKVAGIKLEDGELKDYAERFEELCNLEWADSVSSHALSTLYQRKWNKPTILPLSEDVVNLHKHLNVKITESTKRLSTDPDKLAWYSLATATMAKIILFNRRRSGEVQRMPLEDYQRCNTHTNEDILEDLTEWEKKLCQQLSRVETKGKRGRKVPILLTSEMKEAADTLVETRSSVGVSSTNRYMFARPTLGSKTPLRGSDCLSKMALESGAKCPSALTSTKLRKHIATVSQLFCLKRHELDILANFLGHDIRVHREYYRLPDDTLQMTKVARLLLAMEKGNSNNFRDKKLSEIEVSLDDPCTSEEELVDEDEEDDLPDEINTGASILAKTCNESKKRSSLQARSHSNLSVRKPDQSEQRVVVNKKSHWGNKESDAVQDYFDKHIRLGRVPRKDECDKCKKSLAPLLDDKTWKNIKYKVYSAIQANKRKR